MQGQCAINIPQNWVQGMGLPSYPGRGQARDGV